jgi:hypothetical protein
VPHAFVVKGAGLFLVVFFPAFLAQLTGLNRRLVCVAAAFRPVSLSLFLFGWLSLRVLGWWKRWENVQNKTEPR